MCPSELQCVSINSTKWKYESEFKISCRFRKSLSQDPFPSNKTRLTRAQFGPDQDVALDVTTRKTVTCCFYSTILFLHSRGVGRQIFLTVEQLGQLFSPVSIFLLSSVGCLLSKCQTFPLSTVFEQMYFFSLLLPSTCRTHIIPHRQTLCNSSRVTERANVDS